MSNDNQYDAPCGHCMTTETYVKHTPGELLKARLHDEEAMLEVAKAATEDQRNAITPAPGVEEVVEEFKSLCSDLYDLPYHSTTVVWDRRDTEGIERWLRTLLTTHQREKEALVREMLLVRTKNYPADAVPVGDVLAIAARHGITSNTLKS